MSDLIPLQTLFVECCTNATKIQSVNYQSWLVVITAKLHRSHCLKCLIKHVSFDLHLPILISDDFSIPSFLYLLRLRLHILFLNLNITRYSPFKLFFENYNKERTRLHLSET